MLEILSYLCFIVILSVAGLIRRATHHRACASRQVIKAVHWFEDGQSDEKVGEVMWQGASFGDQADAIDSWKISLQLDLLEIQDPSNVAQQLCRILIQIVSHSLMKHALNLV